MTIDLSDLRNKTDNGGTTSAGKLTAAEFDRLVQAVIANQGGVKKIVRNNVQYTPDADGVVRMTIISDSDLPTVSLTTSDSTANIISTTGTVMLHLRYTSVLTRNGVSEDTGHDGTLTIQRRVLSSAEWQTVGTVQMTPTPQNVATFGSYDISQYLLDGEQQLRVRVTDTDANVSSSYLVFSSVVKTTLSVEFVSDWQNAFAGGDSAEAELKFVMFGAVSKELHLTITGESSGGTAATRTIVLNNATISGYTGRNNPYTYVLRDSIAEACKIMSVHGIHRIEAWLQATADSTVQSEHINCQFFVNNDNTDTAAHLVLQNIRSSVQNYVAGDILEYAVISPAAAAVPLTFSVGNYAGTKEYLRYEVNASRGEKYILNNTIEADDIVGSTGSVYLRVLSGSTDMLTGSIGAAIKAITVDNSQDFMPTSGADFFLNPKTRNNTETNPERILNAADGNAVVAATFTGFGHRNDLWVKDENDQSCLRIRAGQTLAITGYDPWQTYIDQGANYGNQQASMSIELDFAVRNVTDEDTPIIKMCSYMSADSLPLGLEMKPMEGVVMTRSQRVYGQQNFGWQEGVRTHIVINCYHNLGAAGVGQTQVSYVRVFINGVIDREFLFDASRANEFWQNDAGGVASSLGIRLGQSEADLDIYGIRVYRKALSSRDIQQNYKSCLPGSARKVLFAEENDIMADGLISYALASAKYNVIVWHGDNVSGHNESTKADKTGYMEIQMRDASGAVDKAHSGTMTGLTLKGQGSTAKHYYEWNCQWQWKGATGSFVDLNGTDKGQKYQLRTGLPWAKKLVGKINYASSMQSHKAGACDLYDALYKQLVTDWGVTSVEGFSNTRVAVPEEPVLYFVQTSGDSAPVFQGLMTFGPGKADKPTWGYSSGADFAMMEGSDNNFPLSDQRVPWRTEDVTYNADEEYFEYNGEGNIDFDLGRTHTEQDGTGADIAVPDADLVAYYRNAWNWCYRYNCLITFFEGTYEQLLESASLNPKLAYWVTQSSDAAAKFDLFRADYQGRDGSGNDIIAWVPAGLTKTGGVWDTVNLMTDTPVADTSLWASMNTAFQAARAAAWKAGAGTYFSALSLQFHQSFVKLIAGTDNRSKNTYYVLDPTTHKIHLHADDLDTIFKTNNTGWQSKPYYIEEHDTDASGNTYWEGQYNVLFDLTERAYADSLPQMMKGILTGMAGLIQSGDVDKYCSAIPQTPEGAMQKYFYSIQDYFPAVAYNETARIRYETAQLAVAKGEFTAPDGINPVTQSLGRQLESEKQYMKRRMVYLSSYAAYGEFAAGGTTGALSIRGMARTDGTNATMVMTIKTHQWLYPTGAIGNTIVDPHVRLAPGGRLVDATGHPYGSEGYLFAIGTVSGDTSVKLSGINYMRSIGNVAGLSTNPAYSFTVSGERLVEFIAEPAAGQTAQFRPSSVIFTAPNIRTVSLKGCSGIAGEVSLSGLTRLQSVDLRGTSQIGVVLPESETLTSAKLPSRLTELILRNTPSLATLTLEGYGYLTSLRLLENYGTFDTQSFVEACFSASAALTRLDILGTTWTDVSAEMLAWLLGIASSTLTGTMSIAGSNSAVTYALKAAMQSRWGDIDSADNDLYVTYQPRAIQYIVITGAAAAPSAGTYQFNVVPATAGGVAVDYGNNSRSVEWSISQNQYAEIDPDTGLLTVTSVGVETSAGGPEATITCVMTLSDDTTVTATKTVRLYDRSAHVGDYIYHDGTFSDQYDGTKTVVAICFYILKDNQGNVLLRLGVSLADLGSLPWGLYNDAANGVASIVLEDGAYSAYDTPLPNMTSSGISGNISDANYRDASDQGDADGFKVFSSGAMASLGLMTLSTDFHGRRAGDKVPYGWYYTQIIMDHRDRVLGDCGLEIPAASANETAREALMRCIAAVQASGGAAKYQQYYYPAPSFCVAYQPPINASRGEVLDDRFRAGKWWIWSVGEEARVYWYHSKGYAGADNAIFSAARTIGLFAALTSSYYWASQESQSLIAWNVYFGSGAVNGYNKFNGYVVRAVVAF